MPSSSSVMHKIAKELQLCRAGHGTKNRTRSAPIPGFPCRGRGSHGGGLAAVTQAVPAVRHPLRRGRCLHRPARFAPPQGFRNNAGTARRQVWRAAGAYRVVPACGRNVGRAISPAAWGLRYRRVSGTMRASSPTDAGQGPGGLCMIPPTQGGNAPLRLRLEAHPPSGLRCPHRTARAEARLCSATAALPRSGKDRSGERLAPAGAVSEANRAAGPALRPEIGRSYVFYRRTGDNKRSDCRLPHEKQLSPPQAALDSAAPCRGGCRKTATQKAPL